MKALLLAFALLFAQSLAAQADDPASAVRAFYTVYDSQHVQGRGIPDATVRLRLTSVLSPRLNQELSQAAAAQARLGAKVGNAVPPVLEGDIFSSLFEGATGWKTQACQIRGTSARCQVALRYVPPAAAGPRAEKPANWTDTLLLVNTAQGWKVDDVIYDPGLASGNTGSLSEMLAMVIASNP